MFRKMPIILILVILAVLAVAPFMPLELKQFLYSISLSIKAIIVLILPFIVFSLLFKSIVGFSNSSTKIIGSILFFVCCSNFISTFLSHYVGVGIYHLNFSLVIPPRTQELIPLWVWDFPKLIANDKAMFAGILLGLFGVRLAPQQAKKLASYLDKAVVKVLDAFAYVIPLFVAGFIVKLQFDGVVAMIIKQYSLIFLSVAVAQFTYLGLVYWLLNQCNRAKFIHNMKLMLPAAISGFSTMSSAASMPLTLIGVKQNAQDKQLAGAVIPATVNIHLVGDCFAIPIFAYAVMKSFGMEEPSLMVYLSFTFYFILAKFSVAAIPGGGIIVMLPILEAYLGFNSEMMSLITALYILFDPVITSANVLGNGAFAKWIDVFAGKFKVVARISEA